MRVRVAIKARIKLIEAKGWHESRALGLGFEFVRSVDATMGKISRDPTAYRLLENDFRRIVLKRFPYLLIYRISDDEIIIGKSEN
jgi:hypothetical protein